MSQGLNLAQGHGYTDVDGTPLTYRAPIFPLWLALFFKLFGVSLPTAFIATRIFYVLNALLIYLLAARFYDRWAGLVASLLTLTSFSLGEWSALVQLDHVLPALILFYLLTLLWAFAKQRYWQFALVGLLLGIAYLLKEMALLFLPLPLLLWIGIRTFRTKRAVFGIGLFWLVFLLTAAPWWVYVQQVTKESSVLGQGAGPGVFKILLEAITTQGVGWFAQALSAYYINILAPNFGLAPLFALAWLVTLGLALYGRQPEQILLLASLCFLPVLLFLGLENWRPHQAIIFFFFSYLVLVGVLWRGLRLIWQQWRWREQLFQVLAIMLCVALLLGQLRSESGHWWSYAQNYSVIGFLGQGWAGVHPELWREASPAARWLHQHAEPRAALLSFFSFRDALYFFTQGQFPIYKLPLLCSPYYSTTVYPGCELSAGADNKKTVLFLWAANPIKSRELQPRSALVAITEENLLAEIEKYKIRYVVVPFVTGFQSLYFEQSPYFTQVAQFEDGKIKIYQVEQQIASVAFAMHIGSDTQGFLNTLRQQVPFEYEALKGEYLQKTLGLSPSDVERLESGQYPTIEMYRVITPDDYAKLVQGRGPQAMEEAIALQQRKAERIPGNPWPYVTLGALYLAQDNIEEALAAYQQAVAASPDEPQLRLHLAEAYMAKAQMTEEREAYNKALEAYRQALALAPDNPEVRDALIQAYLALGDQYFEQDLLSQVIAVDEKAIALDPDNIQAYWKLAQVYETLGRMDDAIAVYTRATDHWPDRADAHFRLGQAYEAGGDVEKAVAEYQRAVELEPTLTGAYTRLGNLYRNQDRTEDAIALYQAAARKNPTAAWPHVELGKVYLEQVNAP